MRTKTRNARLRTASILIGLLGYASCGQHRHSELSLAVGTLPSGTSVELSTVPADRTYLARVPEDAAGLFSLEVGLYEDRNSDDLLTEDEQVAGAYVESGVDVDHLLTPPLQIAEKWEQTAKTSLVAVVRDHAGERWRICWDYEVEHGFGR